MAPSMRRRTSPALVRKRRRLGPLPRRHPAGRLGTYGQFVGHVRAVDSRVLIERLEVVGAVGRGGEDEAGVVAEGVVVGALQVAAAGVVEFEHQVSAGAGTRGLRDVSGAGDDGKVRPVLVSVFVESVLLDCSVGRQQAGLGARIVYLVGIAFCARGTGSANARSCVGRKLQRERQVVIPILRRRSQGPSETLGVCHVRHPELIGRLAGRIAGQLNHHKNGDR